MIELRSQRRLWDKGTDYQQQKDINPFRTRERKGGSRTIRAQEPGPSSRNWAFRGSAASNMQSLAEMLPKAARETNALTSSFLSPPIFRQCLRLAEATRKQSEREPGKQISLRHKGEQRGPGWVCDEGPSTASPRTAYLIRWWHLVKLVLNFHFYINIVVHKVTFKNWKWKKEKKNDRKFSHLLYSSLLFKRELPWDQKGRGMLIPKQQKADLAFLGKQPLLFPLKPVSIRELTMQLMQMPRQCLP